MGAHWVALVGATPFKCVFVGVMPLSLLAPTFVSRQWRVKVREVLPSVHDVLRFRFCLGCRWNSLLRELDKQNDGVVGYASIVSTSLSFSFLHSCSLSCLWVIWPSPIVIFPLGRLKSSHRSPSPLRLPYFQIPRAYNHKTLRIDRTSGLEISCLLCIGICIP